MQPERDPRIAPQVTTLPQHFNLPPQLDVHCFVDNYATHSHSKVEAWIAARPRWHMHFTPTYNSWINQIERFFALITDKAIRRGSFTSVKQLV